MYTRTVYIHFLKLRSNLLVVSPWTQQTSLEGLKSQSGFLDDHSGTSDTTTPGTVSGTPLYGREDVWGPSSETSIFQGLRPRPRSPSFPRYPTKDNGTENDPDHGPFHSDVSSTVEFLLSTSLVSNRGRLYHSGPVGHEILPDTRRPTGR